MGEADAAGYRYRDWAPLAGSTLVATMPDGDPCSLELVGVTEQEGPGVHFSLVFRAPAGPPFLEQRSYSIAHPTIGEILLFLVPIDPREHGGQMLEAVVNRLDG